jgi:ABC-2 type transport system permease protein
MGLLAFADHGINAYVGTAAWLEAHKQNDFSYRPAHDATAAGRFGSLTASVILQVLLPLCIIALGFAAFSGERESGTWRHLLSLGLERRVFAIGKAVGLSGALGLMLVLATAAGVALLISVGPVGADSPTSARGVLLLCAYLAYLGTWTLLTLAVSAAAPSSRASLLILLAGWMVAILMPRLTSDAARWMYPTPSTLEFNARIAADMRNGIDGHNPEDKRAAELRAQLLKQYNVIREEDLPVNFLGISLQAGEDYGNQVFDKHYGALWQSFALQNRLHLAGSAFSPLPAIREVSMGLSGSDWEHYRHFAQAAETYRRVLVKTMNDELAYRSISRSYEADVRDSETWASVPDFAYRSPGLGGILEQQRAAWIILTLWLGAAACAALWATGRLRAD